MNILRKVTFFLAFIVLSPFVSATDKQNQQVTKVYVNSSNDVLIWITDYSGWLSIGDLKDGEYVSAMYSAALSAKVSGQSNVAILYDETVSGMPKVVYLIIA